MIGSSKIGLRPIRGGGGGAAPNPDFVSTWDTTQAGSASDTIVLPMTAGLTVDWGDGNSDTTNTHTYASGGTYTVTIEGAVNTFRFANSGDKAKITDISNWGGFDISNNSIFFGCSNLDITATDYPTISTTSFLRMFRNCSSMNAVDFSAWDVSAVTTFNEGFWACTFDGGGMESWTTTSLNNMTRAFLSCPNFNANISTWDVSSVSSFQYAFASSSFNQPIGAWTTTSLSSISYMFNNNTVFNQDLDGWDTTNLSSLYACFFNCTSFNGNVSTWDVSGVSSFGAIFAGCTNFNQDVSGWNVSNGSIMTSLFQNCTNFNQNVGGWNVSSVTGLIQVFFGASAFDQDISSWDINQVTNFTNFMKFADLSTTNYDALLIGWDAQGAMSYSGTVNFGVSQYTSGGAAETARTSLIAKWGGIIDGGAA